MVGLSVSIDVPDDLISIDEVRPLLANLRTALREFMAVSGDTEAKGCGFIALVIEKVLGWPGVTGCYVRDGKHVPSGWNVEPSGLPLILDGSADGATGEAPPEALGVIILPASDPRYIEGCRCEQWGGDPVPVPTRPGWTPPPDVDVPVSANVIAGTPIPDGLMVEVTTDNYMVKYAAEHFYTAHALTEAPHIDRAFVLVTGDDWDVFGGVGLAQQDGTWRVKWLGMVKEHSRHGNATAALQALTDLLGPIELDAPMTDDMRGFARSRA